MKEEIYRDQIVKMYTETRSGGTIAKSLGITNYRVYKCLREEGFDIYPRAPERYPFELIKEMYEGGMSTNKIAEKLNIGCSCVWHRLKRRSLLRSREEATELNPNNRTKKSDHSDIIKMYQSGMFASEIGKKYGVKKDAILRILKKYNIEMRDSRGENNANWKGGVTPIHTMIRHHEKYYAMRDEIMVERNYTCEVTGQKGGRLNIHHIKPFAELINDFITNYGSDIPDINLFYQRVCDYKPFWDKSNILLVTEKVHKKIHSNNNSVYYIK